ncbi:hypothetical protein N9C39_06700 [Luminiphilus sp.]|nr:hypothetical protein [Luminiphilus sp.]
MRPVPMAVVLMLAGCVQTPSIVPQQAAGKTVCDTYLIQSMCVQDLQGDGVVDLIYFTDTKEIFMYQNGKRDSVAEVMPFHRCAVPLDAGMQATTNRILNRENLSLTEELSITVELITNYLAAKPSIDACNARFEGNSDEADLPPEGFSQFEEDWDAE